LQLVLGLSLFWLVYRIWGQCLQWLLSQGSGCFTAAGLVTFGVSLYHGTWGRLIKLWCSASPLVPALSWTLTFWLCLSVLVRSQDLSVEGGKITPPPVRIRDLITDARTGNVWLSLTVLPAACFWLNPGDGFITPSSWVWMLLCLNATYTQLPRTCTEYTTHELGRRGSFQELTEMLANNACWSALFWYWGGVEIDNKHVLRIPATDCSAYSALIWK